VGLAVVLRCMGGCGSARVGVSLLFVWGLFGDLSLFGQNKLGDVSSYGWVLQKTHFADGPHGRGSLLYFECLL
jgi:hypothetical protein